MFVLFVKCAIQKVYIVICTSRKFSVICKIRCSVCYGCNVCTTLCNICNRVCNIGTRVCNIGTRVGNIGTIMCTILALLCVILALE